MRLHAYDLTTPGLVRDMNGRPEINTQQVLRTVTLLSIHTQTDKCKTNWKSLEKCKGKYKK